MNNSLVNSKQNSPFFIVGMARSGTTLLRSILNSHPNIAIPRETTFFYLVEEYLKKNKNTSFNKDEVEKFWKWYTQKRRFTYLGLDEDLVYHNLKVLKDFRSFKNVLDAVMLTNLQGNDKKRWGEKTPGHESYLKNIFELYPNAKVVFMIRDPRSVFASLEKVPWNDQFVSVIIKRWNRSVEKYLEYQEDPRVLLITYEELVQNAKTVVRNICEFMGESFIDEMVNNRVDGIPDIQDQSWTTTYEKSVIIKNIDNQSLLKWKSQLSKFEISVIETYVDQNIFNKFYTKNSEKLDFLGSLRYYYLKGNYYLKNKFFKNVKQVQV